MAPEAKSADISRPLDLDPEHAGRVDRPPYGIIDIGSNSVRLVVYDQLGRAPLPRFNEKSLCRLGEGLAQTGAIAADGFRRTVEAVRRFRAIAEAMGVSRLDATATEAMRRASNGPALVEAIRADAGVAVRILSGVEEAQFATLGVISGFFRPVGLVGDMGGGSLEICEALDDRPGENSVSLPLGALPVEALLGEGVRPARRRIDDMLQKNLPSPPKHSVFYAVGGGWRSFAKAQMSVSKSPVQVVHGYRIAAQEARAFAKKLLDLPPAKLAMLPGVATRRARTLPASAMVLDRVLKHLQTREIVFSALGLREGWLYAQLDHDERYLDPLVEGAQLVGLPHARVPGFAATLVDWTAQLLDHEGPAEKRLRVAVCALSDLAWQDHVDIRAEETFRRVLQFPFIGIEHAERVFVAAAIHARYAGRPDAPWLSPAIEVLTPAARRRAQILGRAILLAYRFSGGMPATLAGSRLRVDPDCLHLQVGAAARVPDSEAVSERLAMLAAAIGVGRFQIEELPG